MPAKRKQPTAAAAEAPAVETTNDFTTFDSDSEEEEGSVEMSEEKRAALLKGFDSDTDSDDDVQEDEDNRIIELSSLTPSISSALTKKKKADESGVLYIGRIPHGFYEEEMTSYFSQFGDIANLRLSRSKKTGKSRHFAFIEFADRGVAEIVARTMHNYLLASHLLQVILLTPEEVQAKGGKDLFKGAGKKFKAIPWAQIAKDRVESPKTQQKWQELQKREQKRRTAQTQKIKAAGIDYEYSSVPAKKVKADDDKAVKSKKESAKGGARKASGATGARKSSAQAAARKVSVK